MLSINDMDKKRFNCLVLKQYVSKSVKTYHIEKTSQILTGVGISFTNDWDMESCRKPYRLMNEKGNISPNGDGEWVFQYARMEWLHSFVLAIAETDHSEYKEAYNRVVTNFLSMNNSRDDALASVPSSTLLRKLYYLKKHITQFFVDSKQTFPTYRTLDTAIRCYSLLIDSLYCKDLVTMNTYRERITKDVHFAYNHLRKFDEKSNWGIIICSLVATNFLILEEYDEVSQPANRLVTFLKNQIKKDGGHIENALMYHTNILICLLRLIFWSSIRNYELEPYIIETAKKMSMYAFKVAGPDYMQIQYGDSDSTSIYTPLFIADKVLDLGLPLEKSQSIDYVLLMEFPDILGETSVGKIQNMEVNEVLDAGVWVYKKAPFDIRVFNESNSGGHNHADNGEIVLYYQGIPIFIDGGRFTYDSYDKRVYYRGPLAHNVILIDDGLGWAFAGKNKFAEVPIVRKNVLWNIDGYEAFSCSYEFSKQNISIERTIVSVDDHTIIVKDVAHVDGPHTIKTLWNIDDRNKLIIENAQSALKTPKGILYISHNGKKVGNLKTLLSRHYNEECEIEQLRIEKNFVDKGVIYIVLSDKEHSVLYTEQDYFQIIYKDNNERITI